MKKKMVMILAAVLTLALVLSGCQLVNLRKDSAAGTLLLSVNPEIEISYDEKGNVLGLKAVNEDGSKILENYSGFEGQPCKVVVTELVRRIYEAGCFELELEGNPKNIVIKLEKGSAYPSEAFLNEVAIEVRKVVADQGGQSDTMVVDKDDLNKDGLIGLDKAKELVLAQLDIDEADFTDKEYELDDGRYELEFTAGGIEYDFEVDAYTGKILKAEAEKDDDHDDWDDDDDDDIYVAPTLTLEEAKAAVFAKLGITEDQVTGLEAEYDDDHFEIEFRYNGMEYDYEVDGKTGKILKEDIERDD